MFMLGIMMKIRMKNVAEFDHMKRVEQRAMQNKEVAEVYDKKVRFLLF